MKLFVYTLALVLLVTLATPAIAQSSADPSAAPAGTVQSPTDQMFHYMSDYKQRHKVNEEKEKRLEQKATHWRYYDYTNSEEYCLTSDEAFKRNLGSTSRTKPCDPEKDARLYPANQNK